MTTKTSPTFIEYLNAAYNFLYIESYEGERIREDIRRQVELWNGQCETPVSMFSWDCLRGFTHMSGPKRHLQEDHETVDNPVEVIQRVTKTGGPSICLLENFHRFMDGIETIQAFLNAEADLAAKGIMFCVLSPVRQIPEELIKSFKIISYSLPTKEDLRKTFVSIAQDAGLRKPSEKKLDRLAQSGLGLTTREAERAAGLCLASRTGDLDPEVIADQRSDLIRFSSALEILPPKQNMGELVGMDNLRDYALRALKSPLSRGVILLGPAGVGKSHFGKALGAYVGRPTVVLDLNRIMGAGNSLVGGPEREAVKAIGLLKTQGPCIVYIDELEKMFSGAFSSYNGDGGSKDAVAREFLTWFSDRPDGEAYIVATSNDLSGLPGELMRAGRFDCIFWVDLPGEAARIKILEHYATVYDVDPTSIDPARLDGWSGAEIASLCRTAKIQDCDLEKASDFVVLMSKTKKEQTDALREWARGRSKPAHRESDTVQSVASPKGRRIVTAPSLPLLDEAIN